jgi:hypothetical protein
VRRFAPVLVHPACRRCRALPQRPSDPARSFFERICGVNSTKVVGAVEVRSPSGPERPRGGQSHKVAGDATGSWPSRCTAPQPPEGQEVKPRCSWRIQVSVGRSPLVVGRFQVVGARLQVVVGRLQLVGLRIQVVGGCFQPVGVRFQVVGARLQVVDSRIRVAGESLQRVVERPKSSDSRFRLVVEPFQSRADLRQPVHDDRSVVRRQKQLTVRDDRIPNLLDVNW